MKRIGGKLLLVFLPLILAIFLLYPSYKAYNLQQKKDVAMQKAAKAETPTDSLQIMDKFQQRYGDDLTDARESALKLGLDLRGGMYITLEVDVVKLIEESAQREAIDETFLKVIQATEDDVETSDEPALDLFLENFNEIARPKGKSLISYFDISDIREPSEEKIVEQLQDNALSAIDQALEVMRQRIDQYGLTEPNIQKQGNRRILLELPGVEDEAQIRKLLQTTARLEFKLVRNNEQIVKAFYNIDEYLAQKRKRQEKREEFTGNQPEIETPDTLQQAVAGDESGTLTGEESGTMTAASDTAAADTANPYAGMEEEEALAKYQADHPFTRLFTTMFLQGEGQAARYVPVDYATGTFPQGQYMFRISEDSLDKFLTYMRIPEIQGKIPFDLQVLPSAKSEYTAEDGTEVYGIYSVKKDAELTGDVITNAFVDYDPTTNTPMVIMRMNSDGADRWARITGANIHKRIAIILDDRVYTAPNVQTKITGGSSQITGMEDTKEASLIVTILKAGALKAPVRIIQERIVGPSLGEDSIRSGITASIAAFILVIIYMGFYYNKGGLVADFAVMLNVVIILAILAAFNATLTLPGIAGIILTIGMAVDANILIFERIREEIDKGRSLESAKEEGFSKALSAILDTNITTFITGLILFYFGSGPIQGFAMTLMIGILATLFTAIMVSRAIIEMFLTSGTAKFSFGEPKAATK